MRYNIYIFIKCKVIYKYKKIIISKKKHTNRANLKIKSLKVKKLKMIKDIKNSLDYTVHKYLIIKSHS